MARQPLERPRERRGGRLVAGDEQRDQLVAQRRVGPIVRRGRAAARGCRRARRGRRSRAAARDLLVQQLVDRLAHAAERSRSDALRSGERSRAAAAMRVRRPSPAARRRAARSALVAHAEDGAHDHLERQRLHARPERERRRRAGQRRDLALGDVAGSGRRRPASARRGTRAASVLRSRRWSAPSSSSTERGPSSGRSTALPSPAWSTSGSPVKTWRTASGWLTITQSASDVIRRLNVSPKRARSRAENGPGRVIQPIVCSRPGIRGPGGRRGHAAMTLPPRARHQRDDRRACRRLRAGQSPGAACARCARRR